MIDSFLPSETMMAGPHITMIAAEAECNAIDLGFLRRALGCEVIAEEVRTTGDERVVPFL
jgi:hypothetical protein